MPDLSLARVGELLLAAERLLREARLLHGEGFCTGSVYLAGYVAEITLGFCYAKFHGVGMETSAHAVLFAAQKKGKTLLGSPFMEAHFRQGHSPLFWWQLLIATRRLAGNPLLHRIEVDINPVVQYVQDAWDVKMRYLPSVASKAESLDLIRAVTYLFDEKRRLWR